MGTPSDPLSSLRDASDDELRTLLHEGDAQQRVWAGWALGLRLGAAARSDIHTEVERLQDEGTRRNLLIVLAGLGERELLELMAEHEPSAILRGEALVLSWRTASDPAAVLPFIRERLTRERDPDVLVRLIEVSPPLPKDAIASELWTIATDAPDPAARSAAWAALEEAPGWGSADAWNRVLDERDPELRASLLARWAASSQHALLLRAAVEQSSLREEALAVLRAEERTYPASWLVSEETSSDDAWFILPLLGGPYPPRARWWLVEVCGLLGELDDPELGYYPEATNRLVAAYSSVEPTSLTPDERALADRWERKVRDYDATHGPESEDFDEWDDPMYEARMLLMVLGRDPGQLSWYEHYQLEE